MTNKRPTQDELDEQIKAAIEEIESTPDKEEEETTEAPELDHEPDKEEEGDEHEQEEKEEVIVEDDEEDEKQDDKQDEIDYKKKFSDSAKEARLLHSKNKRINEAIKKANELEEPSDEEMEKEYRDWEEMTDTERRLAKENLLNKKKFDLLGEATQASHDIDTWNDTLEGFTGDPKTLNKYPFLEGRTDEFKMYASDKMGKDLSDLVKMFAFDIQGNKPLKKKGSMMESGSGGSIKNAPKKSDKISLEEASAIRKINYNEYKRLLIAGKIEASV